MTPQPIHVAYLLADAGIVFSDFKKGCSIHARSMIRALEQEGCQVQTFVMRRGRKMPEFDTREIEQSDWVKFWRKHVVETKFRHLLPPNVANALHWLGWHRDFYRDALGKLRKNPPDFLYARHAWLSWPYAKLKKRLRVPLVLEVNAVMSIEKASRGEEAWAWLTKKIDRKGFEAANWILPVSEEIKDQIVAMGISPDKVIVTPNAVDLELFAPRKEFGVGETFSIGCVSSFRAYHGLATLMRAAALLKPRVPNLRLVLIGDGPEMKSIRQLAKELDLEKETELPGVIEHARVADLLGSCDVCVCPNEGEHNQYNCPMKLYEYMALKVPVVASRWGDIPNIIQDGITGLLHRPADPQDLAKALLEVRDNPDETRQRIDRAYADARFHSWRGNARQVLNFVRGDKVTEWAGAESARIIETGRAEDFQTDVLKDEAFAARLIAKANGLPILAHAIFLTPRKKLNHRITKFATACRILLDEGIRFYPLLLCEGAADSMTVAQEIFFRQLGPHPGEILNVVAAPASLVSRVAIWRSEHGANSLAEIANAYLEGAALQSNVLDLRGFLSECIPCAVKQTTVSDGWSHFFQEMTRVESSKAADPSPYRLLRAKETLIPIDDIAHQATNKVIVAVVPAIDEDNRSAHVFLQCCRQLLDEQLSFFVVMLGAEKSDKTARLERAFRETFSAEEGAFFTAETCQRHVVNKIAFGMADPYKKGDIRCLRLIELNSSYQPALALKMRNALQEVNAMGPVEGRPSVMDASCDQNKTGVWSA